LRETQWVDRNGTANQRRTDQMVKGLWSRATLAPWRNRRESLVTVKVYVEGGGDHNKALQTRCRRGFSEFLRKSGLVGRMPRIVACGWRRQAYQSFRTEFREKIGRLWSPGLRVTSEVPFPKKLDLRVFVPEIRHLWILIGVLALGHYRLVKRLGLGAAVHGVRVRLRLARPS
jgi:hypothetical protein